MVETAERTSTPELVRAALNALGVRRLLFAVHDAAFPCDADEDVGRGSPGSRASRRLLRWLGDLGFTGLQLGPQGQTSRVNASPYDGTLFSRNVASLALESLRTEPCAGLLSEAVLARACSRTVAARVDHARAFDTLHGLVHDAFAAFERSDDTLLRDELERFSSEQRGWLERDALYAALSAEFGGKAFRDWDAHADLYAPPFGRERQHAERRAELAQRHAGAMREYAFGQYLAHAQHARFRQCAKQFGLTLYGDLQIGLSDADVWSQRGELLQGYVMGAPPSRTTPEGQPWGYALLDPHPKRAGGARGPALMLLEQRVRKYFDEYDGLRIDHPHGHVCPWVYREDARDPGEAVRSGARLFESPDLLDHPELGRYARVLPSQIDRSQARHADGWVKALTPEQVAHYAESLDLIVETARQRGHDAAGIACEVLSTLPAPLAAVLARTGLGRFRVTQKADLDDPSDVYRSENAEPHDWIMLGNHDTPSVWERVRGFDAEARLRWAIHLGTRLGFSAGERVALSENPGLLAHAMLAEILASRAENASIFFADLLGIEQRYNLPGTWDPKNWSLRIPAAFESEHRVKSARLEALDMPLALSMALTAARPGEGERAELARALWARSAGSQAAWAEAPLGPALAR